LGEVGTVRPVVFFFVGNLLTGFAVTSIYFKSKQQYDLILDRIISELTTSSFLIGITDTQAEASWRWFDGPYEGDVISVGGSCRNDSYFCSWNSGEPNNIGDEDYAIVLGNSRNWNDVGASDSAVWIAMYSTCAIDRV
jgi:hypothetical protein